LDRVEWDLSPTIRKKDIAQKYIDKRTLESLGKWWSGEMRELRWVREKLNYDRMGIFKVIFSFFLFLFFLKKLYRLTLASYLIGSW
jgi:hypothetical protein